MNLTESEQSVMRRIDGTEDIAPYLKPESVLDLMRAAKKMAREIDRLLEVNRRSLAIADERAIEAVKARAENERLTAALESCSSWIERWTAHVGNCAGLGKCTCGRSAVLYDASAALGDQQTGEGK